MKNKPQACTEHHLACSCREAVFNALLMACQQALELRGHYNNANDHWHLTEEEQDHARKEIDKIENEICKSIKNALNNNEIIDE